MYRALDTGEVDVISAFSSDGRIAAQHLTVLADPGHAIPAYDAVVPAFTPPRWRSPDCARAHAPARQDPVEQMREANYMLDRDDDKTTPQDAAAFLAHAAGLPGAR